MKKAFLLLCVLAFTYSCGKEKIINDAATSTLGANSQYRNLLVDEIVDEVNCIDEVIAKYSHTSTFISKIVENADITFCNGKRLRLKIYKLSNNEHMALGYIDGISKLRCLKSDVDFNKKPFIGYEGTLKGSDVKIALGGFSYNGRKLEKSNKLKEKHVKFDLTSYKGGMAIFEDNKLSCWETN